MCKYGHGTRGHPMLQRLLAFVFALVMLVTMVPADLVKADAIEHTHIWATTYDSTNHWEYCTVCGEKRNVTAHVFTDHWNNGKESCFWSNYDTKTCECGYSYIYHKPHDPTKLSGWINVKSSHSHHIECKDCGTWMQNYSCRDSNGKILGCNNPGTCVTCGAVYTADEHKLTNGKCDYCGKQIAIYSTPEITYSDDREYVYIKEKITPVDTDAILQGLWWACSDTNGYFVGNYSIVDDADGISKDYSWTYKFTDYQRFSTWSLACTYIINGTSVHNDYPSFDIWYDHEAPVINEIKQTDQASFNGYATIKQLDVTGTDNASKYVDINITDKITGKNMMEKATVNVVNGKWAYTCTPPLEADDNGRTYTLTAIDKIGNSSTQDFTIYKTDGTAPQVESPLSYTDWTNKEKTVTLTVTDYGSGAPQASLGDQTHYQACTKTTDGKYQITYTFNDDIIGAKNYKLYLKDALGNATSCTLTVGNIDKNTYNISYNLNGGSLNGQPTSYNVESSTFTLPQPTKAGYTFTGWTGSNGATAQKTVTVNKGTRGNLSYTANWQANKYTVTYDANGGTNAPATQSFLYNSGEKLSTQAPVRTGYKFVGWRSGTAVYKPGDSIPSGTMNLDLKAMWIVNSYQVAFDGNGNTKGTMKNECFSYDEPKALNKNTYSKNGYSFKNWNTKADGSGTAYSDEQTISKLANGENISASINPIETFNIDGKGMHYDGLEEDNSLTTGIAYKATYTTTGYTSMGFYSKPYDNAIANNKLAGKRIIVTFKAKALTPMQIKTAGLESISTGPISLGTSWNTYYFTGIIPDNWITMAHAIIFYEPSTIGTVYVGDMSVSIAETVNLYAQWSYNPVSVKVPQVLTGDSKGNSSFRVKCDDLKAGNIKITVPNSFHISRLAKLM